jgi:salicylate hydroxylase
MRVAIVGGGIGGLSAALFLHRTGHDVTVFEQAKRFSEVGAGIQLSPNATRLLDRINVLSDIDALAVHPLRGSHRRWADGSVIGTNPMGPVITERFGAPYLHVHRADLLGVLADAVVQRIGPSAVHLDSRVQRIERTGSLGATVHLEAGNDFPADLVVGADGIHSMVRSFVSGSATSARYSGHVAYRALIENRDLGSLGEPEVNVWLGPGAHVVHYLLRQGELFNLVAVVDSDDQVPESWNQPGDPDVLRARFADWAPELRAVLDRVTTTMRWALHDHQPLDSWINGPVCVLGDAAHPMLPYFAQGGAQSIEDGATLAQCLQGLTSLSELAAGLSAYEQRRKERVTSIQVAARHQGVENHLPDGPEQQARDQRLAAGPGRGSAGGIDIYGHDAEFLETDAR